MRAIEAFKRTELADTDSCYLPRFRGKYLSVSREDAGEVSPIRRLEYTRGKVNWYFAIFRYTDQSYDEETMFFRGNEFVDGTIEGAMNAGMVAYD